MPGLDDLPIDARTDGIPTAVPPSVKGTAELGFINLPGYTKEDRAAATAPSAEGPDIWSRIAYGLEGFGAGYKGQEPLALKVRRQQMLEDQQRQEREIKLTQMKQQQSQQQFEQAWGIITNPNANAETKIGALNSISDQNQVAKSLSPFATKQIVGDIARALPYIDPKLRGEFEKLRQDSSYKPNIPGGISAVEAEVKRGVKLADDDEKATGDDRRYDAVLEEARVAGGLSKLPRSKQDLVIKRQQEDEERKLKVLELDQKLKLTTSQAEVAGATKTAQIAEASQQAAPRMRQYPVDQEGNVRVEQFDGTKWTVLADKVKASPTTSINLGGEPKAMPPEQAARFSHFLEARGAAKQLPGLIFDKQGNIKSENLLTGAFPMGGLPFTEGRTLNQVIERGIQAKLRAETGAAAPENEVKNIALRYKPSISDSKEQIKGKLEAFTNYIEDAIWLADPTGAHQGRAAARKPVGDANKRGDALEKLHPDWNDYEVLSRLNAEGY